MSIKDFAGGVIGSDVVPSGPARTNSASGVWTLDKVAEYNAQGLWPDPSVYQYYFGYVGDPYGSTNYQAFAATTDSEKNNIIVGNFPGNNYYAAVLKYNIQGEFLWAVRMQYGSVFYNCKVDSDDNIYVSGSYFGTFYVAKLDPNGNRLWQRSINGTSGTSTKQLEVSSTGDVFVLGTFSNGSYNEGWLAKINTSGTLIWEKRYYGSGNYTVYLTSLAMDETNNVLYFVGRSAGAGFPRSQEIHKVRMSDGFPLLQRYFNAGDDTGSPFVTVDDNSRVIVTFSQNSGGTIIVVVLSTVFAVIAATQINSTYPSYPAAIKTDANSNIYLTGTDTYTSQAFNRYGANFVTKLNSSLTLQWNKFFYGTAQSNQTNMENPNLTINSDATPIVSAYTTAPGAGGQIVAVLEVIPPDGGQNGSLFFAGITYSWGDKTNTTISTPSVNVGSGVLVTQASTTQPFINTPNNYVTFTEAMTLSPANGY